MLKKQKPTRDNTISDVLGKINSRYLINSKFTEIELETIWPQVVGPMVANCTTEVRVVKSTIYIRFDNAAVKNEMFNRRLQLLEAINQGLGRQQLEKIFIQ
jgi:hypothetical protein